MRILRALPVLMILIGIHLALGPEALDAQATTHNCSFCHNLHGGSQGTLSDHAVVEDLCNSCHGALGPDSVYFDQTLREVPKAGRGANPNSYFVVHNGQKHVDNSRAPTGCWDCHGHEGEAGSNLKLILDQLPTPLSGTLPVVLTSTSWSGSGSMGDNDAPVGGYYDGVCQACHTVTDVHRNDEIQPNPPNKTHDIGVDCTTCHSHDTGFQGAGSCSTCHDTGGAGTTGPNNRRAIIPEFSRLSHHADNVSDDDCEVCHDYSSRTGSHPQGAVTLWNVDFPASVDSAIVLSGDPQTSSTEAAKLTKFCIRCHDSNGANGTTAPFSDATDRVLIDETAWLASSHEGSANIAGCYGNGTFGCHASGHGSEKQNLLAPPETAPASNFLNEAEEGFCLNCHDSDGPATSNIAVGFSQPIRWVPEPTGLQSLPALNDRHDVQGEAQDSSGAKIECSDCHNVHQATSAQPFILDPDPTDSHVPAAGTLYSGSSLVSEFCLACHDNSFPAGVQTHSADTLTNIRNTFTGTGNTDDGMGVRVSGGKRWQADILDQITIWNGSTFDTIPQPWAIGEIFNCEDCHSPHPGSKTNLFAFVDTLRTAGGDAIAYDATVDPPTLDYSLTDPTDNTGIATSGYFCNSCHDRTGMNSNSYCYANCHLHGDGTGI